MPVPDTAVPVPADTPQVTRVPNGGVDAGGGSTADVDNGSLLTVGIGLLLLAAFTGRLTRRAGLHRRCG